MDDLTFRKTIYAEPFTTDPAVVKAAANDPKKQAFWDDIKQMEAELKAAMHIRVPENLAEKLILRQSLSEHKKASQKRPWYLAIAAAVVLVSVLSIGMFNTGNSKLVDDVFAHMSHVNFEVTKASLTSTSAINEKLASFNGQIIGDLGDVVSANYCYLDKIKSLHLIIRSNNGLTSVFVVPDAITESIGDTLSNASYAGASFLFGSARVIVVGQSRADVNALKSLAQKTMSFSA
jgi:hypothetical protein